ncbi:MAG: hypothetical protein AAFU85_22290 [Planctomycetota bacterium]
MDYETEINVNADAHEVVDNAIHALVACGMKLDRRETKEATLCGPGLRSTNQNPVLGATTLRLIERDHPNPRIIVHADLGGVRWIGRFIIRFPLLLSLGLLVIYFLVQWFGAGLGLAAIPPAVHWAVFGTALLVAFPWLLIQPIIVRKLTAKTEQAIADLIRSADRMATCERPESVAVE